MLGSSSSTTLLWCVVLAIELCLVSSTSQAIYCTTDKTIKTPCICREVKQVNWSNDDEEPAPRPDNMTLTLLHYNSREQQDCIRVLVAWTQKASHFQSNYVMGYDIEATVGHLNSPKYFECSTKNIAAQSGMVSFIFNDTAILSWCPIPPGEEITYKIDARPIYTNDSNPSSIDRNIYTPLKDSYRKPSDFENGKPSDFENVSESDNAKTPITTTTESYITDSWHFYVASAFVIALGVTLVLLTCFVCRKIFQNKQELRRILVIGNSNDINSTKICTRVIEMLKQCSDENVEIETNIRKSSEVGEHGILQWISEKVTNMDVVIFVVLSLDDYAVMGGNRRSNSTQYKDFTHVAMAMKAAQTVMLRRSQNSTKFLAYSSCKHPDGGFYQCYHMESEQKKFLKQALGSLYKPDRSTKKRLPIKTRQKILTSFEDDTDAMLEYNSNDDLCETPQNDLNQSANFSTEYVSSTMSNIGGSSIGDLCDSPRNDLNQSANFGTKYMTSTIGNIGGSTSTYRPIESIENNEMV